MASRGFCFHSWTRMIQIEMGSLKISLTLLVFFGFLCVSNSNPITSLFGKSSDDKAEVDEKAEAPAAAAAKPAAEATTTTTPSPATSCGGLKGFLHICDKNEATEPPKSVKTRSVDGDDDSDSDSDSSEEKEETSSAVSEGTEKAVEKRQAEEVPEAPEEMTEEVPMEKRQAEEDESDSSEEEEERRRRRRDCRDGYGDYEKDCRKKREYVPAGVLLGKEEETTERDS